MNVKKLVAACAVASSLVSFNSWAGDDGGFTLGAMAGAMRLDNELDADDPKFGSVSGGYEYHSGWAAELDYRIFELEFAGSPDAFDHSILSLNGLYHFGEFDKVRLYGLLGVGQLSRDLSASTDAQETVMNAGFGLKIPVFKGLSLRPEFRHIRDFGSELNHNSFGIGLQYMFGVGSAPVTTEIPVEAPVVPAPIADGDQDGIFDDVDQCLNTPVNEKVDATGCALDSDGDGIADSMDNCPDSSEGSKVDDKGCYIIITKVKEIELEVNFENNSSEVTIDSMTEIEKVAEFLKQYPLTSVVIEGHTDDRGAAAYNMQLSQSRADAVAEMLVAQFNIDASRVSAKGFGESQPRDSNDTAEGRANNRRVTAQVSATVEEVEKR